MVGLDENTQSQQDALSSNTALKKHRFVVFVVFIARIITKVFVILPASVSLSPVM